MNLHCDPMCVAGTSKTAGNTSHVCYIRLYSHVTSQYYYTLWCVTLNFTAMSPLNITTHSGVLH